ncbi:Extracellular solute-binding protein family 1 [Nostocoides japonicum T1-X7]|uniref:Extracellular solute-binding protein family 1 n=1 Tax=Nostocoides japonicum T1-X7 TaxID=1194083 RepID=A0A077LY54_9MICO|nr:extracellular solute-binding protein [Tetrasphaera japonica]CCH77837.1 Extracellular solute-binding protein family 1 [Tetrasphaera japonica T1-X7]
MQHPARGSVTRRSLLVGIGAAGVGVTLAGCSAGSRGGSSSATTISFYLSKPEVIPYFQKLIAKYHREQDKVRVVMDSSSNVPADFVRNQPPDLGCWNYNFSVAEFVNHGALMDLGRTPQAQSINPDLWPLMKQTADYPGRTSAIPYSVMAASVIYNRDIFAKHEITVPTTWTGLTAACEKLRSAGVTPFFNTYADTWTIAQGPFDYSIGGMLDVPGFFADMKDEGTKVGKGSAVSFEKDFAEPMEHMVELDKYANKDAASRKYGDGNTAFAQGKGAMYMQGPWALSQIALTNPKMSLGTFPLPVTDDPKDLKVRVNVDLALWIPEASSKKEAALDFMAWLMQPRINDTYNDDNDGFGSRRDAPPPSNPTLAGMRKFYSSGAFYLGPSQLIPGSIPVANYAQAMMLGSSPSSQLRTLDNDWARYSIRVS